LHYCFTEFSPILRINAHARKTWQYHFICIFIVPPFYYRLLLLLKCELLYLTTKNVNIGYLKWKIINSYEIANTERMEKRRGDHARWYRYERIAVLQNIFCSMQMFFGTGTPPHRKNILLSDSRFPKFWAVKHERTRYFCACIPIDEILYRFFFSRIKKKSQYLKRNERCKIKSLSFV